MNDEDEKTFTVPDFGKEPRELAEEDFESASKFVIDATRKFEADSDKNAAEDCLVIDISNDRKSKYFSFAV